MHVYREHNSEANLLSKRGIGEMDFTIYYEIREGTMYQWEGTMVLIDCHI